MKVTSVKVDVTDYTITFHVADQRKAIKVNSSVMHNVLYWVTETLINTPDFHISIDDLVALISFGLLPKK